MFFDFIIIPDKAKQKQEELSTTVKSFDSRLIVYSGYCEPSTSYRAQTSPLTRPVKVHLVSGDGIKFIQDVFGEPIKVMRTIKISIMSTFHLLSCVPHILISEICTLFR